MPGVFSIETVRAIRAGLDQTGVAMAGVCRRLLTDASYKLLITQVRAARRLSSRCVNENVPPCPRLALIASGGRAEGCP